MRAARLRPLPAACAVALACTLAACGKSAHVARAPTQGPAKNLAPLAAEGAVSLTTRNTTRLGGADVASDAAAVARAVYPGLTVASRPQAVVLVDEHDWAAALSASLLAAAPLGAPLLYTSGGSLPDVTRETLEALHPAGASALAGAQVIRIGAAAAAPAGLVSRSLPAGAAASTAAAVLALSPLAHSARAVIVVPSDAPQAMQMPAAGLAAEAGAPILFVGRSRVPAATSTALAGLHRPSIYVIDSAQISPSTLTTLGSMGHVSEITSGAGPAQGEAATANAIAVARFTDGTFGWGVKEPGHGLVFASAARPLDAPAAAPLSATGDYAPLMLFEGANAIPPALSTYLGNIQPAYTSSPSFRPVRGVYNHGWLIGDEHAISAVAQAEIDSLLQISPRKGSEEPNVAQPE
jgi:hypothetical protein